MLIALLASLATAPGASGTVVVHHRVVTLEPVWISQPTRDDIDREYPVIAKQAHDDGRVVLECTAQDDGSLAACSIVSETPPGEGFGDATLRLTSRYRMAPTDAKGRPVKGFRAQLIVAWGVLS
ncbi:MAG TPA: energy transducer TonB [Caulobacteraceae bacterium]|jgi:protein TonB|nr:energy transducer TonB [Caulobacteraceae bacterium]